MNIIFTTELAQTIRGPWVGWLHIWTRGNNHANNLGDCVQAQHTEDSADRDTCGIQLRFLASTTRDLLTKLGHKVEVRHGL